MSCNNLIIAILLNSFAPTRRILECSITETFFIRYTSYQGKFVGHFFHSTSNKLIVRTGKPLICYYKRKINYEKFNLFLEDFLLSNEGLRSDIKIQ